MHAPPSADTLAAWRHHLRDEADAAFLYEVLAERELNAERRDLFRRLAEVEHRHTAVWRSVLAEHGTEITHVPPSARARLLAWITKYVGSDLLVSLMFREEGQEVKSYLQLHRRSPLGTARDAALLLARESAEHARTLGSVTGSVEEPWHRMSSGGFLRNVVYGFNDGLTANFGLVAGVIGASVEPHIVMVSGVAGMIADALSMGSSGYLAAKSEREVYAHEMTMEAEEIRIMPEVEEEELALLYEAKGMPPDHARALARDVMRNPERALEEKAREELGIAEAHSTPLREGWITGAATAIGAFIPVAPFLALDGPAAVWTSFAVAMASHFAVGAARSVFTGRGIVRSGLDMFVVGLGVAVVGYFIGDMVAKWLA
ncbi:MAG TPA: VIT1/CCC1 transporter family protein [Gemmatimonadales bacterium]|nr:VIT1/CCC1 transporter family protein [Gemmatimonadales bacterium]